MENIRKDWAAKKEGPKIGKVKAAITVRDREDGGLKKNKKN